MRNVPVAEVDSIERAIVAIGTDYPARHLLPAHRHRRAQVLYAATGIMRVDTAHGTWTVPIGRAVLIPPGVDHEVLMEGVSTRSLYLEPAAVPWFPERCRVVAISPMLRELIFAAVDMVPEYNIRGRAGTLSDLVLHELRTLTPVPFEIPLPRSAELRRLCAIRRSRNRIRQAMRRRPARRRFTSAAETV